MSYRCRSGLRPKGNPHEPVRRPRAAYAARRPHPPPQPPAPSPHGPIPPRHQAVAAPTEGLTVQIRPIVTNLQATLANQAAVSGDPAVDAAVAHLVEALGPALHVAAMEIAEQAAAEVGAQLPDHDVAVVLV